MQEIQTFLEIVQASSTAKCCFWTRQCTTHTPAPSLSKRWERFRRVPCRGKGGAATSWWGENPTHSPNRKHSGSQFRLRNGIHGNEKKKKIQSSHTQLGWVGQNKTKQKIDRHRKWFWKSQQKCNLDFHFKRFEVSGIHLLSPPAPAMWPKQTEIILTLNILRNSPLMYLEIPRKRGSWLLVSFFFFFFFSPWLISWWLCSTVNAKGLLLLV